ncbi:MAG: hypothetical protein ACP5UQ_13350 [Anaerolineae bacterium]
MNVYRTDVVFAAPSHVRAVPADQPPREPHAEFAAPPVAGRPSTQAERSVMHPEWQDPEWRYYHGAWGG